MNYKLQYFSNVKDGNLQNNVRQLIAKELKVFNDKRVSITIEKIKSIRSCQQNRYLHLLFTIFKNELNELGNEFTMEEIKELCKSKFSTIDVFNKETGECIGQRIKGTHEMSKGEMVDFIESVIRWAADMFHIVLPAANEQIDLDI